MSAPADKLPRADICCQGGWTKGQRIKCTAEAKFIVRIHILDHCDEFSDLDPNGNRVFFCCGQCVAATGYRLNDMITDLYANLPEQLPCPKCHVLLDIDHTCAICNAVYEPKVICLRCQRPITALRDLLDVEAL